MNKAFLLLMFTMIIKISNAKARDTTLVIKDPRIDVLVNKQALINKRALLLTSSGLFKGYRIQVVNTPNKDLAFKIKSDLLKKFIDQKTYLVFQSPNFKVRIGNFIRKEDAERFKDKLNKYYPQNTYIMEDAIEYAMPLDGELPIQPNN